MNLAIQFALWTSVIIFLCSKGEPDVFNWTAVLPYFRKLCEITEDCDNTSSNNTNTKLRVKNPCCKGCDCALGCAEDRKLELYSGITKCISSIGDGEYSVHGYRYRFVVDEPKNGCELTSDIQSGRNASCQQTDEEFTSLDNFYPVYSFDKDVNFKNRLCALCHGSRNITDWNIYGFYKIEDLYNVNKYNSQNWSKASIEYYPPNLESQQDENTCYDLIDNCPDEFRDIFYIPSDITMTRQHIMDACNEGPISHYIRTKKIRYKNVFCALCNAYASGRTDTVKCDGSIFEYFDSKPTSRSPNKPLAFLIDHMDTGSTTKSEIKVPTPVFARLKNQNYTSGEKTNREVLCPTLQVRQPDGKCNFPMEKTFIGKMLITINLTLPYIVDELHLTNMSQTQLEALFRGSMPWPRNWEIVALLLRVDELKNNRTEFVVLVGYQVFDVLDIAKLMRLIQDKIFKGWIINISGNTHVFQQNFHIHGEFERVRIDMVEFLKPRWSLGHDNDSAILDLPSPAWKMILSNSFRFFSNFAIEIRITNLFFCNQVTLYPYEYRGNLRFLPIFLERQNRFLYPYEFHMYEGGEGDDDKVTTICLEDSDYHILQNNRCSLYFEIYHEMTFLVFILSLTT